MNRQIIRDLFGMNFTQVDSYFNSNNNLQDNISPQTDNSLCSYCNVPFQVTFRNNRGYLLGKCRNPKCPKYNSLQYVK
jgi:hypothetical protein